MIESVQRWAAAQWWRASGRVRRDREALYGGATGLRIVTIHETLPHQLEQVKRIVRWSREALEIASPADADDLFAGRWRPRPRDRILFTFDDGLSSNFAAARWLAGEGIAAIFFVVPTLVDRTRSEFLRFHEGYGVKAHPPKATFDDRGLTTAQVREMMAMGHRVAAHNYAHRDLGKLHTPDEIRYEVANALEALGELTGRPCQDFAIGFGQPENLSDEAAAYLLKRCPRVYACHRGLNVPGRTQRFALRHAFEPAHPFAFTRVCLEGGADRRLADRQREMIRRVGLLPGGEAPSRA